MSKLLIAQYLNDLSRLKQVIEPSSATVVAALLRHRERFAGKRVGVVLSGGNVDLDAVATLFSRA